MMNKIKNLSKKTKVILLAVCLIAIAGIGSVITACTNAKPDDGADENKAVATESVTKATEQATEQATEKATEEVTEDTTEEPTEKATENTTEEATEKPTEKPTEKKDKENKKEEATIIQTTTTIVGDNQTNSNNNSNNNTNTGTATQSKPVNNTTNNNTTTNNTTPSKVWHEAEYKTVHHPAETKKVWVVDQEGYTYEEPVYEEQARAICYTCGADCTENRTAHGKQHMLNGENSSYGVEYRQVQTGTKTITVEEKGHWETQVIKEAWDEQVLIREAGYY